VKNKNKKREDVDVKSGVQKNGQLSGKKKSKDLGGQNEGGKKLTSARKRETGQRKVTSTLRRDKKGDLNCNTIEGGGWAKSLGSKILVRFWGRKKLIASSIDTRGNGDRGSKKKCATKAFGLRRGRRRGFHLAGIRGGGQKRSVVKGVGRKEVGWFEMGRHQVRKVENLQVPLEDNAETVKFRAGGREKWRKKRFGGKVA